MFSKFPIQALSFGVFLAIVSAAQLIAFGQTQPRPTPPTFNGDTIPSPPRQNAPWLPAQTSLPKNFVTATETLFAQGLADPRGCEYREVEVAAASVWGGSGIVKTHAWVFPLSSLNPAQRFAVGWNGLVYPVISVRQRADLRDDILRVLMADEALRARRKIESPDFPFYRFQNAIPESASMSTEMLLPLKGCLLLRLGETQLAEKLWTTWIAGMDRQVNNDAIHLDDPYLMLATEWTWALFDRAVTAHMRGDDKLSLSSARALLSIRDAVEAEADRHAAFLTGYGASEPGQRTHYLLFLGSLPDLLADETRRVAELSGTRGRADVRAEVNMVDSRTSVEGLIRDLEEIRATQWGQPGGVDLRGDAIVKAIIAQGSAAVEPLLNVLENDTRLTRSVSFGRDFHYDRHLIGVHEAAYVALVEILRTSYFGSDQNSSGLQDLAGRRARAAQIRSYLKEYGNLPPEERWYRILIDDRAGEDRWLEAAAYIVQRSNYPDRPPSWAFTDSRAPQPGDSFHLRGEPLRSKTNPTVSELLVRRMNDLSRPAAETPQFSLQKAVSFALALGTWDGPKHMAELQQLMAHLTDQYATVNGSNDIYKRPQLIGLITSLTLKRCEIGDQQTFHEYATWLRTVIPADTEYATVSLFEPALRYPNASEIETAIRWMFTDSSYAWNPLIPLKVDYYNIDSAKLLETLMNFAAFREQTLKALEDKSTVGVLVPRPASPDDKYDLRVENNIAAAAAGAPNASATAVSIARSDPLAPQPPLSSTSFRVCDVYTWRLRGYEGAPRIQLYWTEAQRDEAVKAAIAFLRNHEGQFIYSRERAYKYTQ